MHYIHHRIPNSTFTISAVQVCVCKLTLEGSAFTHVRHIIILKAKCVMFIILEFPV